MDRAADLVLGSFDSVCFRGDTDFALTKHFDRWSDEGKNFAFGTDAIRKLVQAAEDLPESSWKPLKRPEKRIVQTGPRRRPENVKERIVVEREYRNIKLDSEHVAEFGKGVRHQKRTLLDRWDILVSGRKAAVFKLLRIDNRRPSNEITA